MFCWCVIRSVWQLEVGIKTCALLSSGVVNALRFLVSVRFTMLPAANCTHRTYCTCTDVWSPQMLLRVPVVALHHTHTHTTATSSCTVQHNNIACTTTRVYYTLTNTIHNAPHFQPPHERTLRDADAAATHPPPQARSATVARFTIHTAAERRTRGREQSERE